ncbi:MAG: alpha/beta hydrolase [Oscillospiraceae bacterium]|nr:alpha/beta hydrolase [Oscillospiraceae bacterium]
MEKVSFTAKAAELYLRATYGRRTADSVRKALAELEKQAPVPYVLPKSLRLSSRVSEESVCGCQVFRLCGPEPPVRTVIYLHGGSYVNQITKFHWHACDRIAGLCRAEVIAPLYTLVPYGTWKEAFELAETVLDRCRSGHPERPVILMGDSAGGGLALALCEELAVKGIPQPDRTVLFSPWVDVDLDNPDIRDYVNKDPFLTPALSIYGERWTGDLDTGDRRISPLFGDVTGLGPLALFAGTKEIAYPDIMLLAEKLREAGADFELIVGKGMCHVWPLFPIPEGRAALRRAAEIING